MAPSTFAALGVGALGAAWMLWWVAGASTPPGTETSVHEPSAEAPPASQPASKPTWHRPRFTARQHERDRMVDYQIARGWHRVRDARVLAAMRNVPRHEFVPPRDRARAYDDSPLPIGRDQTISQPLMVAYMTEALKLEAGEKVLEIGTGCGYQAAVLTELTPHVLTIEIVEPLAKEAAERLKRLDYATVRCRTGDGFRGWPEEAPFDGIVVTCAPPEVPQPLIDQLAVGGRLVIPVGDEHETQQLVVITKQKSGETRERLMPVRFVPMTGRAQE